MASTIAPGDYDADFSAMSMRHLRAIEKNVQELCVRGFEKPLKLCAAFENTEDKFVNITSRPNCVVSKFLELFKTRLQIVIHSVKILDDNQETDKVLLGKLH